MSSGYKIAWILKKRTFPYGCEVSLTIKSLQLLILVLDKYLFPVIKQSIINKQMKVQNKQYYLLPRPKIT